MLSTLKHPFSHDSGRVFFSPLSLLISVRFYEIFAFQKHFIKESLSISGADTLLSFTHSLDEIFQGNLAVTATYALHCCEIFTTTTKTHTGSISLFCLLCSWIMVLFFFFLFFRGVLVERVFVSALCPSKSMFLVCLLLT